MSHRLRAARRDLPAPIGAIMVEVAADFGLGPEQVLAATAIDEAALAAPDTRISMRDQERMLRTASGSGDPAALHFAAASRWPRSASGYALKLPQRRN
jgi:hypothetical protein